MNLTKHPALVATLGLVLLPALSPVRADSISSSWSGASASVYFGQQSPSQQGNTAQASAGGTLSVSFWGSSPTVPFQGNVTGNVTATAGGDPAHLLQVTGSSSAPEVGTIWHNYNGPTNGLGGASASWTNDAAIVTTPAGSSSPEMIRLNFTLTFSADHGIGPYATLTATANGTSLSYWGSDMTPAQNPYPAQPSLGLHSDPDNADAVDSSTVDSSNGWATKLTDTFHLDLPLSKAGLSNPFSLGLQLSPYIGLVSNSNLTSGLTANIALTSVTLPDGTPLSALGDTVSFESGLTPPAAAPESASLLVWGVVAAAGAGIAVRGPRSAVRSR